MDFCMFFPVLCFPSTVPPKNMLVDFLLDTQMIMTKIKHIVKTD